MSTSSIAEEWEDVTDVFKTTKDGMAPGRLLSSPDFRLRNCASAFQLNDPRVDYEAKQDYQVLPKVKDLLAHTPSYLIKPNARQLLAMIDQLVAMEETFFQGAAIAQSVMLFLYFHESLVTSPQASTAAADALAASTSTSTSSATAADGTASSSSSTSSSATPQNPPPLMKGRSLRSKAKGKPAQTQAQAQAQPQEDSKAGSSSTTTTSSSSSSSTPVPVAKPPRAMISTPSLHAYSLAYLRSIGAAVASVMRALVYDNDEFFSNMFGLDLCMDLSVDECVKLILEQEAVLEERIKIINAATGGAAGGAGGKKGQKASAATATTAPSVDSQAPECKAAAIIAEELAASASASLFVGLENLSLARQAKLCSSLLARYRHRKALLQARGMLAHMDFVGVVPALKHLQQARSQLAIILDQKPTNAEDLPLQVYEDATTMTTSTSSSSTSTPASSSSSSPPSSPKGAVAAPGSPSIVAALEATPGFFTSISAAILEEVYVRKIAFISPLTAYQAQASDITSLYRILSILTHPPAPSPFVAKAITNASTPHPHSIDRTPATLHFTEAPTPTVSVRGPLPPDTLIDTLRALTVLRPGLVARSQVVCLMQGDTNFFGCGPLSRTVDAYLRYVSPGLTGWIDAEPEAFPAFTRFSLTMQNVLASVLTGMCERELQVRKRASNVTTQLGQMAYNVSDMDESIQMELMRQGFDIRQSYAPPGEGMMNTFPYKHPFFAATFELTTMMFIQHILVSLDLKLYQVAELPYVLYVLEYVSGYRLSNYTMALRNAGTPGSLGVGPGKGKRRNKANEKAILSHLMQPTPIPPQSREILFTQVVNGLARGLLAMVLAYRAAGVTLPELPQFKDASMAATWFHNRFSMFTKVLHPSMPNFQEVAGKVDSWKKGSVSSFIADSSASFKAAQASAATFLKLYPATPTTSSPASASTASAPASAAVYDPCTPASLNNTPPPLMEALATRMSHLSAVASRNSTNLLTALKLWQGKNAAAAAGNPPPHKVFVWDWSLSREFPVVSAGDKPVSSRSAA